MQIIQSQAKDYTLDNETTVKVDQRKESYYFSHDANARNDIKLLRVRREHGPAGYAIYFMIIEILREQHDYRLPVSSIADIAFDLRITEEITKSIIGDFDLFKIEEGHFFSARLCRSMDQYNSRKLKLIEAGRKGGQAKLKPSLSDPQALKKRKEKESKGNKSKVNEIVDSQFENFWNLYDKKVGKENTIKQWQKLSDHEKDLVFKYVPRYQTSQPEKKFRKDPANFLKNKCFNDEIIDSSTGKPVLAIIKTREQGYSDYIQAAN